MVPTIPACEDNQLPQLTSPGSIIGSLILLVEDKEHDEEAKDDNDRS